MGEFFFLFKFKEYDTAQSAWREEGGPLPEQVAASPSQHKHSLLFVPLLPPCGHTET